MSFFGFDTSLPKDRGHNPKAPGFSLAPDPFAGLSSRTGGGEKEVLDFEDTYDGLGDQLDETGDAFNDDTFGEEPVGKDFDFSGQTSKISGTMQEEQAFFDARQPPPKMSPQKLAAKPVRSGYEGYKQADYIPSLEVNASLWGMPSKAKSPDLSASHRQQSSGPSVQIGRKMMSLEEVEAAMRSQSQKPAAVQQSAAQHLPPPSQPISQAFPQGLSLPGYPTFSAPSPQVDTTQQRASGGPQMLQRPTKASDQQVLPHNGAQGVQAQTPQILQRPSQSQAQPPTLTPGPQASSNRASPQSIQILQNPNRVPGPAAVQPPQVAEGVGGMAPTGPTHGRGLSGQVPIVTRPEQLLGLSEDERAAFLLEDARRAKRNHKIYLLSKDNGLMTPQDKNFITRIQLQQLVTATGNVIDEHGPEAALNEDFYYQVHAQIRGPPRQNPHQPLSQFAQTYLFQTGGRPGNANRRHPRGGENHVQRMEQQVQRAVEAAKLKPKNKQLVIEGSLGKISFSNAKTPKPLLNIKRPESRDLRSQSGTHVPTRSNDSVATRRQTLKDIERLYMTLMAMEDHERRMPPPPNEETPADLIQEHIEWRQKMQELNQSLWNDLKVMEPIDPNSPIGHPFMAILSLPKGKKVIPRVFRHIDDQQRITILTMICLYLDQLDVVRLAAPADPNDTTATLPPPAVRDSVELFSQAVMPSLFGYVNDAPLQIVVGLLGLLLDRVNTALILRTKVGLAILTMLVSRAELIKQATSAQSTQGINEREWQQWNALYNQLFDKAEPVLPYIFPPSTNHPSDADDVHVWQFLAAMAVGANEDQQRRLVVAVKDCVNDTVEQSKALPPEIAGRRLGNVNLFMRAIGLDVDLLQR
ncbi:hypothetical protein EV356DRAFT_562750 [Viridothelium virens]|uniref:mRNA decay factor PAT1 domain-containing protein n=1 Tax=Viridothelium virens TaxID=1048519 RepID=A0A6A6HR48_VIRVR|nr:hypothetical protein EV356DRAFT_562750 [Viridothelium virens]